MKNIKFILTLLISIIALTRVAHAAECPDYTGTYQLLDERNHTNTALSINQNQCLDMDAGYIFTQGFSVSRHIFFDNQKHMVFQSTEMSTEETSFINQNGITINSIDTYKRENKKYLSQTQMTLDENKNLIEKIDHFNEDGNIRFTEINIYLRQANTKSI